MSARRTTWRPWNPLLPTFSSEMPIDRQRESLFAIVCAVAMNRGAVVPGWSYTNSVTLGEASPGTAALPAREYMVYGTGNATKIVSMENTYDGSGNLTSRICSYSNDNGATTAALCDALGNSVQNLAYDGSSNLTATSWAKT